MDTEVDTAPEPLFRPAKRRKFLRRRPQDNADSNDAADEARSESSENARLGPGTQTTLDQNKEESSSDTGIVRLRRPRAVHKGGIRFSATSRPGRDDSRQQQTALEPTVDPEKEKVQLMCDRFTAYTGQTVDVDKHMYGFPRETMSVLGGLTR